MKVKSNALFPYESTAIAVSRVDENARRSLNALVCGQEQFVALDESVAEVKSRSEPATDIRKQQVNESGAGAGLPLIGGRPCGRPACLGATTLYPFALHSQLAGSAFLQGLAAGVIPSATANPADSSPATQQNPPPGQNEDQISLARQQEKQLVATILAATDLLERELGVSGPLSALEFTWSTAAAWRSWTQEPAPDVVSAAFSSAKALIDGFEALSVWIPQLGDAKQYTAVPGLLLKIGDALYQAHLLSNKRD